MARKLLVLSLLLAGALLAYGQDQITRSDGVVIRAKVLEMPPGLVRFRLFGQADTLVYQISTLDLQAVRMADGTERVFSGTTKKPPFNYETSSGRNILWYYPVELVYPTFTLAYERILAAGKLGLKMPLMIGLSGKSANNYSPDIRQHTRFGTGLDVHFYPFGQGRFQYYVGPALQYRIYRAYFYYTYSGSQPGPHLQDTDMFSLALKNGVFYQFSRFFIVSVDAGLGYRFLREAEGLNKYYLEHRDRQILTGNLHLGYRF